MGKFQPKRIESIMRKLLINNCNKESNIWIYVYFMQNNVKNICIKGQGIIDGRGEEFSEFRPMMFRYLECENITLEQIHLEAPASWTNAFYRMYKHKG